MEQEHREQGGEERLRLVGDLEGRRLEVRRGDEDEVALYRVCERGDRALECAVGGQVGAKQRDEAARAAERERCEREANGQLENLGRKDRHRGTVLWARILAVVGA